MLFKVLPIFLRIGGFFGMQASATAALTAMPAAMPMVKLRIIQNPSVFRVGLVLPENGKLYSVIFFF